MALTFTQVKNAQAKNKRYYLNDENGLRLSVEPNGTKYFVGRKQINGNRHDIYCGKFNPKKVSSFKMEKGIHDTDSDSVNGPAQARRRYAKKIDLIECGLDPNQIEIDKKNKPLFKTAANDWMEAKSRHWEADTEFKVERRFANWVFKKIAKKRIDLITTRDIVDILEDINNAERTETRDKVKGYLFNVFRFAKAKMWVENNPADFDIKDLGMQPHKGKRFSSLDWELRFQFWDDITSYEGTPKQAVSGGRCGLHPVTQAAIKLQVLTFVRPGELRNAQWSEFDLDGKEYGFPLWTVPAARMKRRKTNPNPHLVPLSKQAIEILRDLQNISGHLPQVFPGMPGKSDKINPNGLMSAETVRKACQRLGYPIHAHGFRHMASTALNEALIDEHEDNPKRKFDSDWIEMALSHCHKDKIRGVYDMSKHLRARYKMMQWYSDQFCPRPGGATINIEKWIPLAA